MVKTLIWNRLESHVDTLLRSQFAGARSIADLQDPILSLSDHFNSDVRGPTPWHTPQLAFAYLVYFHPLNYLRARRTAQEALRSDPDFFSRFDAIVDIGSGSGAALFAFLDEIRMAKQPLPKQIIALDRSIEALSHLRRIADEEIKPRLLATADASQARAVLRQAKRVLAVASYSLNEHTAPQQFLNEWPASGYAIIEPSTRRHFAALLEMRARLLALGHLIFAPCPHQQNCPLGQDQRDWCHSRVSQLALPSWWSELDRVLPIKNRTITMSFLVSQSPAQANSVSVGVAQWARLVGDTRLEKGQSRQLICTSAEKQWLRWFNKRVKGLPKDYELPRDLRISLEKLPPAKGGVREIDDPQPFADPAQPAWSASELE